MHTKGQVIRLLQSNFSLEVIRFHTVAFQWTAKTCRDCQEQKPKRVLCGSGVTWSLSLPVKSKIGDVRLRQVQISHVGTQTEDLTHLGNNTPVNTLVTQTQRPSSRAHESTNARVGPFSGYPPPHYFFISYYLFFPFFFPRAFRVFFNTPKLSGKFSWRILHLFQFPFFFLSIAVWHLSSNIDLFFKT